MSNKSYIGYKVFFRIAKIQATVRAGIKPGFIYFEHGPRHRSIEFEYIDDNGNNFIENSCDVLEPPKNQEIKDIKQYGIVKFMQETK